MGALGDTDHAFIRWYIIVDTAGFGWCRTPPYAIEYDCYSCKGLPAFVSEPFGDEADELRNRGGDGRIRRSSQAMLRRVGWFDAVAWPWLHDAGAKRLQLRL